MEKNEKLVHNKKRESVTFKFKDIFKAWNHTWRMHRLLISALTFILSAVVIFLILGNSLFAFIDNPQLKILLQFKFIISIIIVSILFFISKMCIAYSIRKEVVDDELFVGWKDIGKFLKKHLKTFIFYILGWIVIFALIGIGQLCFYAIGSIPYFGSLWFSVLYLIPFLISVFFVLTLVVLMFCDTFGAVMIGVEQKSAMDTIIGLYHLVKDKGIYVVVCEFISLLVGLIATYFVLFVTYFGIVITNYGAKLIMGKELLNITLPKFFWFLTIPFQNNSFCAGSGGFYTISGFILGLSLILIASLGISYLHTYMTSAETFIYLSSQDKFYPKKEEEKKKEEKD